MDELGIALGTVQGLRAFPYSAARVAPPAAVVLWPDEIAYDQSMARGSDRITLPVLVIVGRVDERSARDRLAGYLDGAGPTSVKAAVEAYEATSWDSAVVTTARAGEAPESGGTVHLGAVFQIDIFGSGVG